MMVSFLLVVVALFHGRRNMWKTPGRFCKWQTNETPGLPRNEARFVDFRFTDTRSKEQHVAIPAHAFPMIHNQMQRG
jgi:hypothetical protein